MTIPSITYNFSLECAFANITYITLDGRFMRAYGHHSVLLNHFHHGEKVSLPYQLACSMDHTIK